MFKLDEYQAVILSSLLHDIGKFWQRTKETFDDTRLCQNVPSHRKFDECDKCKEEFAYQHAVLAQAFFEDYVVTPWKKYGSPALYHHVPVDYKSKIVALADKLSAMEREKREEQDTEQLVSIFSRIQGKYPPPPEKYLNLKPLSLNRTVLFPSEVALTSTKEAYKKLWKAFTCELFRLNNSYQSSTSALTKDFESYLNNLYYLLQKYTWSLPSAHYETLPDVSLFDHLRTTCALAASLYRSNISEAEIDSLLARIKLDEEKIEISEKTPEVLTKPLLSLIKGDISGIQSFLYTLTSQGVAKGLKGRSFYLQLMTEVISRWLLRRLELPLANLIYVGGGHFYLLSYYLGEKIKKYQAELSRVLLKYHKGDLYLALSEVSLAPIDFFPHRFSNKWQEVEQSLVKAKRQRFSELPATELHEQFFTPQGGRVADVCAVCHREGAKHAIDDDPLGRKKCSLCYSLENLGHKLKDAQYLLLSFSQQAMPVTEIDEWKSLFNSLEIDVELVDNLREVSQKLKKEQQALLYVLNNTAFRKGTRELLKEFPSLGLGFYFLANVIPRKKGEVADFADIAQESEGIHRLGVLRMDVDNLGHLFQRGLGDAATLSRMASLSFFLRLFFEGWLNQICQDENQNNCIYTIYSGGDDLFIVGSWNILPLLARKISFEFREFTCENLNITLSGGIAVEAPKFPLYQFARLAQEALDRAKKRKENIKIVKNAIDFLGHTFSWEDFQEVQEWMQKLKSWVEPSEKIDENKAPRALLHLLMSLFINYERDLAKIKRQALKPWQLFYGRWMWLSNYYLFRLAERIEEPKLKQDVLDLRQELLKPGMLRKISVAARWAELLTRQPEQR